MEDSAVTSVSQKKVLPLKNAIESIISGYRIIDTVILNSIFGEMKCPVCSSFGLFVTEESAKKKGLASHLSVKCSECAYERSFYTSSRSDDKTFDINKRIIYSMRACGQGYASVETFTTLMDMPKPMTKNNYKSVVLKFIESAKEVAEETMADAMVQCNV